MDEKPKKSDIKDLLLRKSELLKKKDFILKRRADRYNNVQETDKKITLLSSIIIQSPAKRNSADAYPGPSSKTLRWSVERPAAFMKELQDNTYCSNVPIEEIASDWKDTVANCQDFGVLVEDPVAGINNVQDDTYYPAAPIEVISSDMGDTNASCPVVGVSVEDPATGINKVQDDTYYPVAPIEVISSDMRHTNVSCPVVGVSVEDSVADIEKVQDDTYYPAAPIEVISSDMRDTNVSCPVVGVSVEDSAADIKKVQDDTYYPAAPIEVISSDMRDTNVSCPVVGVSVEDPAAGIKKVQDNTYCPDAPIEEMYFIMKDAEPNINAFIVPVEKPEEKLPENNSEIQSRKRSIDSNFVKYCMDFMSQEDVGDFSSGSSDLWSPKDSENESLSEQEKKQKKKQKKKKKKASTEEQTSIPLIKTKRTNKEKIRKTLQSKGLSYETRSGRTKEARSVKNNPCQIEQCSRKCYEIPEERRKSLFEYFWSLDSQQKKEWIVQCAQRVAKKRKKTDAAESRRSSSFIYYINEGEGRRQVCQQFILKTLDISQTYILYNVQKSAEGIAQLEHRKRYAANKYDENTKMFAHTYIKSLPVLPSHYSRKTSQKLYLPEEFKHTSNLYRLYKKYCEKESQTYLSERLFTTLFKEYNIAFHYPKKDKCKFCLRYNNLEERTEKDLVEYQRHREEREASYKRCEIHRNLVHKDKAVLVSSFDLQKVLNTPHGESMLLYYSRKYAVFNLTVYESGTQNGYCYTWGESEGKRGSFEIGTCLHKYLTEVNNRGLKYLILYCDSCSGQNKNRTILTVFKNFLETSTNLEVIQINYLLPGHTYMSVDSMHSVIEREVRKLIVWSPSQWPTYMQAARKNPRPYEVVTLHHTDFIDWQPKTNDTFTNKTLSNKNLKLKDLRIVTFKKQDLNYMEVKYTMKKEGETYKILLGQKLERKAKGKGKGKVAATLTRQNNTSECLQKLYKNQLPISLAKYKDLKKLCDEDIIPKLYHSDYLNLPHDGQIVDTISETDETETENENIEDQIAKQCFNKEDRDILLKRKKKEVVEKEITTSCVDGAKGKGKGKGKGRAKVT
ncbi:hypothetical protein ACJJTC_004531 [Scirpophaga incertulas]